MGIQNLHTTLGSRLSATKVLTTISCLLLILLSIGNLSAQTPCDNVTDGGSLAGDETGCANPIFDPSPITSVNAPTGGSGELEFLWMRTTGDPSAPFNEWNIIPGAKGLTYDPTPIFQTTYYARCSRRASCVDYDGETNYITKEIKCCNFDVTISPSAITVCLGTSIELATNRSDNATFSWTATGGSLETPNGATTIFSATTAGTYSVSVLIKDSNGCEGTATVPVTFSNLLASASVTNASCGNADGSITASITGGTAPYSFDWGDQFGNSATINNLEAGLYIAIVTDANGCATTLSREVMGTEDIVSTITTTASTCTDTQSGAINLAVSGGQAPYIINWDQGLGSSSNPTGLSPGAYAVTITDQNGCNTTDVAVVDGPANLTISFETQNASCSNSNDGRIELSVSQGVAPYTYEWTNNSSTSATAENLAPGTYEVTVIDAAACSSFATMSILAPPALTATIATGSFCSETSGTATIEVAGGTLGYSYIWNDPSNQTTQQATNLSAGVYSATITDAVGCTVLATTTINAGGLLVTAETQKTTCAGPSSGTINISVENGVAPFSYQWTNGLPNRSNLDSLPKGDYAVTVTDATGCTGAVETQIDEDTGFLISVDLENATCNKNNGRAVVSIEGAADNYTYRWNDISNQTGPAAAGLAPATYTVTVTNTTGCSLTEKAPIVQLSSNLSVSIFPTNSKICAGETVSFTSDIIGTVTDYSWSTNSGAFDFPNEANPTFSTTTNGIHTIILTVRDNLGCEASDTATVEMVAPNGGEISTTDNTLICVSDGRSDIVNATLNGNVGEASNWLVTDKNGNILIVTNNPAFDFEGIEEGICFIQHISYNISLTTEIAIGANLHDITGCFDLSNQIRIERLAGENCTALCKVEGGTLSTTDITTFCVGDGIADLVNLTLEGNEGEQSTWAITDVNRNILALPTTPSFDFEDTEAGICYIWHISSIYPITELAVGGSLNDISECHSLSANTLAVTRLATADVTINASANRTCRNTAVSLSTNLTGSNYTYQWSTVGDFLDDPNSATPVFTASAPGSFIVSLQISDGNCSSTATTMIDVQDDLQIAPQVRPTQCEGLNTGSISVSIFGGSAPFIYSWTDSLGTTDNLANLREGSYSLTITDAIGCSTNATIEVPSESTISLVVTGTNLQCHGDQSGSITAVASGGTAPYKYIWNGQEEARTTIDGLAGGIYQIEVIDSLGCSAVSQLTLIDPPALTADIMILPSTCNTLGSAAITSSGGTGSYTYQWSLPDSPNEPNLEGLSAGTYSVKISDENNCSIEKEVVIEYLGIKACGINMINPITSANGMEGAIIMEVDGNGGYSYTWNTGDSVSVLDNLAAGTYIATASDEYGCSCTDTITLYDPTKIGDLVFEDKNNNGLQDLGEDGLRGVNIQLGGVSDNGDIILLETKTDEEGNYSFLVPSGEYKITVTDYLNLKVSPLNVGEDEALDSDLDPITYMSDFIQISSGIYYLDLDVGLVPSGFCENVLTGGSIGEDEEICAPNGDPELMYNITYPTGGAGELEYLWLTSHKPEYTPGDPDWSEIPNSNHEFYDPSTIAGPTYFIRCVRRKGCNNYPGETNVVSKLLVGCDSMPTAEGLRVAVLDNQVQLNWTGNISVDNSTFVIERSEDGINYQALKATSGHLSTSYTQYDYMDESPMMGENYYRIKTVHPEMGYHISNIAMAMVKPSKDLRVTMYPNPIHNELMIHFLEELPEMAHLEIANGFGQVIRTVYIDSTNKKHLLDMSDLPGGLYYIKFQNKMLKRYSQKIIKRDQY